MELNSCACGMKVFFNLNSKENEKINFFSQETYDFQILGNETLIITRTYKNFYFSVVGCKVMVNIGRPKKNCPMFDLVY